ncbi:hypothetical protein BGLA2_2630003 [Burkholderia gladioli]|nr:hypothetical protein BGLA2_2630003 [Burkholderia gladioli]
MARGVRAHPAPYAALGKSLSVEF